MNLGVWLGLLTAAALIAWGVSSAGAGTTLVNLHGLLVVVGGTTAAALISTPFGRLASAFARAASLLMPLRQPGPDEAIAEILRLARLAQAGGGLLSIQEEGREFAGGFVRRAVTVAIATGESAQTRHILEKQIRQTRVGRQEDSNVFRTISVLAPMFGILGTLLGMIQVLGALSDPAKVGPAMAVALSSAFLGIAIANFLCIPLAGQLRLDAMRETLVFEVLVEGILEIQAGRPPYLIELHLASYSAEQRARLEAEEARPVPQPG